MIDNVHLFVRLDNFRFFKGNEELIRFGELDFIAHRCKKNLHIKNYQREHKNLLYTLLPEGLKIANSLHKSNNKNNYNDFNFSQLIASIKEIEDITNIPAENFKITRLEIAFNIKVTKKGYEYLEDFGRFKHKDFHKMITRGFWYGVKYLLSEYNFKIYDKTELLKRQEKINLNENLLRFEMQYNVNRRIPAVKTLYDLKSRNKLIKLFTSFLKEFDSLKCVGDENFSGISPRERELYFAGQHSKFWIVEKAHNRNTAKSKKAKYDKICNIVASQNLTIEFVKRIKEKFDFLINN